MTHRIEMLESELGSARTQRQEVADSAAVLAQRVEELSAAAQRAVEVEGLRAQLSALERELGSVKEEHTRAVMRATVAETRIEELAGQLNDFDQRASHAEWETEKSRSDLEAARKRSAGLESELARIVRRTTELERDVVTLRRSEDEATRQSQALRTQLDGARAAAEGIRTELAQAVDGFGSSQAALRAYSETTSTVSAALAELDLEEGRVAEARRKTLADVRDLLARAERGVLDAQQTPPTGIMIAKVVGASGSGDAEKSAPRARNASRPAIPRPPRPSVADDDPTEIHRRKA
jgi:DNA repair exonuclease SbcCD ATPase subunit